jgi:hypothetical protein
MPTPREEMLMPTATTRGVYEDFVAAHYVGTPLRSAAHVQAVLEAAGLEPEDVDSHFWERMRPEWVWGLSAVPFAGAGAKRANTEYRRLCELYGTEP